MRNPRHEERNQIVRRSEGYTVHDRLHNAIWLQTGDVHYPEWRSAPQFAMLRDTMRLRLMGAVNER